jgi:hypothetical protein
MIYTFLKDFAGPIATMIAACVAAGITFFFNRSQTRIASLQADVAIEKLNFESHRLDASRGVASSRCRIIL